MKFDELLTALRRLKIETGGIQCLGCGFENNCGTHGCAVIRQAAVYLDLLRDSAPKWISAKERLPACGDRVLATDGIFVGEAYRTSAQSWYRSTGFPWRECLETTVTHWMPLPAPPEEVIRDG